MRRKSVPGKLKGEVVYRATPFCRDYYWLLNCPDQITQVLLPVLQEI